jgi:hypothetical protein
MLGAVALLGMLTLSSLAARPPEVSDNPADPIKSLPAGGSTMPQAAPSAEPSSQDAQGFLDRMRQLQAGRNMAAPLPPSLRPERLPTPALYRLPVSARKRLAASVLFAIHPLLVLAPTDEALDSPGDHPHPVEGSAWLQELATDDRRMPPAETVLGYGFDRIGAGAFDVDRTLGYATDAPMPRWIYVLVSRRGESCSTNPSTADSSWLQSIPPGDVILQYGSILCWQVDREPFDWKWLVSRWLAFRHVVEESAAALWPVKDTWVSSLPQDPEPKRRGFRINGSGQSDNARRWEALWWDEQTGRFVGVPFTPRQVPARPPVEFLLAAAGPESQEEPAEYLEIMPKEEAPATPATACPFQHPSAEKDKTLLADDADLLPDVLTNLHRLTQARRLLDVAGELRTDGRLGEALTCCQLARNLVPGSPLDADACDMMAQVVVQLFGVGDAPKVAHEQHAVPQVQEIKASAVLQQVRDELERIQALVRSALTLQKVGEFFAGRAAPAPSKHEDAYPPHAGAEASSLPPDGNAAPAHIRTALTSPPKPSIEKVLGRPITLNLTDTPLKQFVEDLRGSLGINVYLDGVALQEAGISSERPLCAKLADVRLKTALDLLLKPMHLTYVVKDEVLFITSETNARGKLVRAVYSVADLVADDDGGADGSALRHVITSNVEPKTWNDMGGSGTIDYFPPKKALVINQTPEVQEQIVDLLAALHRLQDEEEESTPAQDGEWWEPVLRLLQAIPLPFPRLINIYSSDPNARINQLLNQSEDLPRNDAEWEHIWNQNPPSHLKPERVHGGIQEQESRREPTPSPTQLGVEVQVAGLMKACRLAAEGGDCMHAAELARQAYALDPARASTDRVVARMYRRGRPSDPGLSASTTNSLDCRCPAGAVRP